MKNSKNTNEAKQRLNRIFASVLAAAVAIPSTAVCAADLNTGDLNTCDLNSSDVNLSDKLLAESDKVDEINKIDLTDVNARDTAYLNNTEAADDDSRIQLYATESAQTAGDIRWDFVTDAEGFAADDSATTVNFSGKDMRVTGTTPHIKISGVSIKPAAHKYLYIRMLNNSKCWQGQIYMFKDGYTNIARIDYTKYNNQNKDKYMYYKIPLADLIVQAGTLQEEYNELRFDFSNVALDEGTGYIDIDYIVVSGEESLKDSEFINPRDFIKSINIGGNTLECSGLENAVYYEANVYEDIYEELSKDDISAAIKDGMGATVTDISLKEVKDRKIVDVTATDGSNSQSVRVVCKSVIRPVYINVDKCDISRKSISFSGNLTDDKGEPSSSPVTSIAYKVGETVAEGSIKFVKTVIPDKDGKFSLTFNVNDKEETAEKYEMAVVFDAMGATVPEMRNLTYLNDKYASGNIEQLKASDTDMLEYMQNADNKSVYERLGVWIDLYNSQSDEVKDKINQYANSYKNNLTENNAAEIANASILAVIAKDLSDEKLAELLVKYDKDSCGLEISDKAFGDFEEKSQTNIADKIKQNYNPVNYKEMKAAVREAMLLEETADVSYMKIKDLLLANTDILGDPMSELSSLTDEDILDSAMKSVSVTAKNSGFASAAKLAEAVKSAIKTAKAEANSTSGSSGSSSSSGGSSGSFGLSGKPSSATDNTDADNASGVDSGFADMYGYDWALEAVNALADKGIVNGVGDNNFEPDATVKREEFVKMIVNAFNLSVSDEVTAVVFTDVNKDDWFYPYIVSATENGVVNGISDSRFGVGEDITRQDMAVIIYRVLESLGKINGEAAQAAFTDYDEISEYAKAAVNLLSVEGIVNGTDGNRFSPLSSATRAEAAVIIYRCINK